MSKGSIDWQEGDNEYIGQFHHNVDMLTGMVKEMMVTTPSMVLSPVLREMLVEKAAQVEKQSWRIKTHGRLRVDNLGEPLNG
jgi:hypothetical protein